MDGVLIDKEMNTAENEQKTIRPKKIKAIVFDLGDTLINYGKVNINGLFCQSAKVSYQYLKELGQPVGDFKTYSRKNLSSLRLHYVWSHITGNDFDSLALLKKIWTKRNVKLDDKQWEHYQQLWYEPIRDAASTEPDLKQTISTLKSMGIKLGILSNTFINRVALEGHLHELGILDMFDMRMYSYQYKFRKPNKNIFIEASEKIGESFENMMFIGDRIDNDVKPSLKLGMTAVLKKAYTNDGKRVPDEAYKIEKLSELIGLVEKLNS